MFSLFERPNLLFLALPLSVLLVWWYRRQAQVWVDRRLRYRLLFRALALGALVLALAGFRIPGERQSLQIVAAIDLSDSVYDPASQQAELEALADTLREPNAELGVVTFGRTAGLERPLAPLPGEAEARATRGTPAPARLDGPPPLPDLLHPQAVIERDGTDVGLALRSARGRFKEDRPGASAIVLVGDGLDTEGQALAAAESLRGSGIDLLVRPAAMEATGDVLLESVRCPERGRVGLGVPLDVTVRGQAEARVKVRVLRHTGSQVHLVGLKVVELKGHADARGRDFRAVATLVDRPETPGVARYEVVVEGPEGEELPRDFRKNNTLWAAVPISGPARWAVLAREASPLAVWARQGRRLGVELTLYEPGRFPLRGEAYRGFAGVLVDGLSAGELKPGGEALQALREALEAGVGLVAIGGEQAFGAGRHPEGGLWERLLPVTLRPEDDRTRAVLFVVDVSGSMGIRIGGQDGQLKLAFAQKQLGAAVTKLRPTDRVGLIAFSGSAQTVAKLDADPSRAAFIEALNRLQLEKQTNFLAAFAEAAKILKPDDAEEQLAILLSDGEPLPPVELKDLEAAVQALCPPPPSAERPRRTKLLCFGIGTGPQDANPSGEARLKQMAAAGGGAFYPDFLQLGRRLEQVFDERKEDLYTRRGGFDVAAPAYRHEVLEAAGEPWPRLPFRNRLKARPQSEVLLWSRPPAGTEAVQGSRKPDPLIVLGHSGAARTAVLALALEGPAGQALLAPREGWRGGQALLAALLAWCGGDEPEDRRGWRVETEARAGRKLAVTLYAREEPSQVARNGLRLAARLRGLDGGEALAPAQPLLPVAPGTYRADLPLPAPGVYRLSLLDGPDGHAQAERLVTAPYPAEYRRFGTDRYALQELAEAAGGRSRMLNLPRHDLDAWKRELGPQRDYRPARSGLLVLALLSVLAEVAARGLRARR
ncbi:MAG: VWA domain-containing protein [Planctomycetota bacterium]|nr:VWA domain-containing protein [Planctomycetota bacterium]